MQLKYGKDYYVERKRSNKEKRKTMWRINLQWERKNTSLSSVPSFETLFTTTCDVNEITYSAKYILVRELLSTTFPAGFELDVEMIGRPCRDDTIVSFVQNLAARL